MLNEFALGMANTYLPSKQALLLFITLPRRAKKNGRGCSYARSKSCQRQVLLRSKRTPLEHGVAARSTARA